MAQGFSPAFFTALKGCATSQLETALGLRSQRKALRHFPKCGYNRAWLKKRNTAWLQPMTRRRTAGWGFLEHLDELRQRLIRACIALAAGMLVAFLFVNRIADFVLAPTLRTLPPGTDLIATRPGETFSFYLNVALIGGVVIAAPFVMYQVWRFIAPGLRERKEARRAVPGADDPRHARRRALHALRDVPGDDGVFRDVQF